MASLLKSLKRKLGNRNRDRLSSNASVNTSLYSRSTTDISTLPILPQPRPRALTISSASKEDTKPLETSQIHGTEGGSGLRHQENQPEQACLQQSQSSFFQKLPLEIRLQIYESLFGRRNISLALRRSKSKTAASPWVWYYSCFDGRLDRESMYYWREIVLEREDAATLRKDELEHMKLHSVTEWLRTCRFGYSEALRVLYGSNTFSLPISSASGTELSGLPFFNILPQLFPPSHLAIMTSLQLVIRLSDVVQPPDRFQQPDLTQIMYALSSSNTYPRLKTLKLAIRGADLDLLVHEDPELAAASHYLAIYGSNRDGSTIPYKRLEPAVIADQTAEEMYHAWLDPISDLVQWRKEQYPDPISVTVTLPFSFWKLFFDVSTRKRLASEERPSSQAQNRQSPGMEKHVSALGKLTEKEERAWQQKIWERELGFAVKYCDDDWPDAMTFGITIGCVAWGL